MYLYDRQLTGIAAEWGAYQGAQPPPPHYQIGAPVAPPRGLALLEHFHVPKQPDPRTPGRLAPGSVTRLDVKDMNPGFIDANDQLITDTGSGGLQTCLRRLITTQFRNYLGHPQNTAPSAGDRLRVALVDLTGPKLARPDFAGWGSTVSMYGASVPKILALYGAYQLRMDLRQLAASQGISTGRALEQAALLRWRIKSYLPNLVWLFDIRKWSGDPSAMDFTPAARKVFEGIMHNAEAGELITKVGFPYTGSMAWQSGLYHPTRRGLWLTSSYGKGQWAGNPMPNVYSANVTALSAATYFTLLAQGRLVEDASSSEITTWLASGCFTWLFPDNLGLVASKCGIWSDYLHDCALIVRDRIRYVVVGLTRTKRTEHATYTRLFQELDKLIVQNNQTPKPSC